MSLCCAATGRMDRPREQRDRDATIHAGTALRPKLDPFLCLSLSLSRAHALRLHGTSQQFLGISV